MIDTTAPTVTNVTSTTANGSYPAGATIPVTVAFSEPVTVTGSPQLALNTGGVGDLRLRQRDGSTLTFDYTVQAATTAPTSTTPRRARSTLNGGTINDAATNNADADPARRRVLRARSAFNKNIVIDTTAPTVTNVTATNANGSYKAGDVDPCHGRLQRARRPSPASPKLALNTTPAESATYATGSGTIDADVRLHRPGGRQQRRSSSTSRRAR